MTRATAHKHKPGLSARRMLRSCDNLLAIEGTGRRQSTASARSVGCKKLTALEELNIKTCVESALFNVVSAWY